MTRVSGQNNFNTVDHTYFDQTNGGAATTTTGIRLIGDAYIPSAPTQMIELHNMGPTTIYYAFTDETSAGSPTVGLPLASGSEKTIGTFNSDIIDPSKIYIACASTLEVRGHVITTSRS